MVFSSILFLFRFMPIVFGIYYLTPRRFKNAVLFVASLIFYSWGEVRYLPLVLLSTLVDYVASLGIERRRAKGFRGRGYLALSLIFNVGSLGFFKYSGFLAENLNALLGTSIPVMAFTLPLGISFYTFQTMSYTIDVYRDDVKVEHNIINFGTYVTLFPQLIAGPIVRYSDVARELQERTHSLEGVGKGIQTFIMGLGSKVLIANNIGSLWTRVSAMDFATVSTPLAWLGILAFALQIYFDFSGYSLMAIGLGKMLGFEFPQNFNYPYISKSITEFWRRWHMTLGSWFREYLYIPLGGNRKGVARQYFNILVVWATTGLWHGANWNFVLWGLYFAVFLCIEKAFLLSALEKSRVLSRIYLLTLVLISWVLFAITDFALLGQFFTRLFGGYAGSDWIYYLRNYRITFVLGFLFSTPILRKVRDKIGENHILVTAFCAVVFILSVAYLVDSTYNPFLYFRF
ncbi:MAG: MBOAT family O-acyltransferase [Oscillospiraceae bacterium]|jgi:alginate O-acetyltransferase complex protein AlgI